MPTVKRKFERYEAGTLTPNPSGSLFAHDGTFFDLSSISVMGSYIDTIRHLYEGKVNEEMLEKITDVLADNCDYIQLFDREWMVGKCSRQSGYQYRLQNNDLGVIILFKSYHNKEHVQATHVKIELSPWFIETRTPEQIQESLSSWATQLLIDCNPNRPAVHLALDVQGWAPAADFISRFKCRSRRVRELDGIQEATFDLSEISATYGKGQSYLFGSAGGLQLAIYNKTKQAKATDKLDYMQDKWRRSSGYYDDPEADGVYDPSKDVFRIEARFHHSVVEQFCSGSVDTKTGEMSLKGAKTYLEISSHLQGLWDYAMDSYKLMFNTQTVDPIWQLFQEDAKFDTPDPVVSMNYKRYYKSANGFSGKNVDLFMGNWLSIISRSRKSPAHAWKELKQMSVFPVIEEYYASKGIFTRELKQKIKIALRDRKLRGYQV